MSGEGSLTGRKMALGRVESTISTQKLLRNALQVRKPCARRWWDHLFSPKRHLYWLEPLRAAAFGAVRVLPGRLDFYRQHPRNTDT